MLRRMIPQVLPGTSISETRTFVLIARKERKLNSKENIFGEKYLRHETIWARFIGTTSHLSSTFDPFSSFTLLEENINLALFYYYFKNELGAYIDNIVENDSLL